MDFSFENIVLVIGGVLTGLHAGLLYDFSVDIVPSLRKIKPLSHISMMQTINVTIENPLFFPSFLGPIILLPLTTILLWGAPQTAWLLAASIIQILGCNLVTIVGNIPLNKKLDKINKESLSEEEAEKIRKDFQGPWSPWMRWHTLRTISGIIATAVLFMVCISK